MLLHMRLVLGAVAAFLFFFSSAASAQTAIPAPSDTVVPPPRSPSKPPQFRLPFVLNSHSPSAPVSNIYGGPEVEQNSSVATDGAGHWVAVWHSTDTLQGRSGRDYDILVARSIDNGVTWSAPALLNTNATT